MKPIHLLGNIVLLVGGHAATVRAAGSEDCLDVALGAIPSCAQSCFLNGAPSVGCGGTDFACQCEREARLYAAIEGCVSSGCPSASYQAVIDGASSVCSCATSCMGGGMGSMTVGGSYIGSLPPTTGGAASTTSTRAPSTTATTTTTTPQPGSGGSTSAYAPPTTTPSSFATAVPVSGAVSLVTPGVWAMAGSAILLAFHSF